MPKITKALTAIEVKRLTAPKMHAVGTVPGLMLDIKTSGAKAWILRTTVGTRRSDIGLGGFPGVTLCAKTLPCKALDATLPANSI